MRSREVKSLGLMSSSVEFDESEMIMDVMLGGVRVKLRFNEQQTKRIHEHSGKHLPEELKN